jgi:thioredoxin-like negative regulator of GroEL
MLRVNSYFLGFAVTTVFMAFATCTFAAQNSGMDNAVKLYLNGSYEEALPKFQALAKADAGNAKIHYYEALCLQRISKYQEAADEYKLALKNCKDPAFEEILKARLNKVEMHLGKGSAPNFAPQLATKHGSVHKVIYFSTNWCPTCKGFTPVWDSIKSQYKKVSFDHLNAEDPACWKEVEKYKPKGYPTLVYVDDKGTVIQAGPDSPSLEGFKKTLDKYGAK